MTDPSVIIMRLIVYEEHRIHEKENNDKNYL